MVQPLILLVEGDPDIRHLVQEVLGEQYRVEAVGAAADAVAILSQSPPDAVVIECMLPGGGTETLLRQAEAAGLPVLLTSGHPGMIATYTDRGHAFLAKPYRMAQLLNAVATLTRTRGLGSESAARG